MPRMRVPGPASNLPQTRVSEPLASATPSSRCTSCTTMKDLPPKRAMLEDTGVTPAELFFVREHFAAPSVDTLTWKLAVTGAVATPLSIPHAEFVKLSRKTLPVTIECAENAVGGGLVSHAEWEGVPLAAILTQAQPRSDAKFVSLLGADGFARTLPLEKVSHADTLLAFRMNGESLPPQHGAPVRAIVPGWYGVASIKWLERIELLTAAPEPKDYVRRTRSLLAGVTVGEPVTRVLIKSVFSRPLDGAILYGRRFTLRGAAWAGENMVRGVEVSSDGGRSWAAAKLSPPVRYSWTHWTFEWKIPSRGKFDLAVRATDDAGVTQPAERDSGRADDYEQNHWQRIAVTAA